jgi:hypothetical protein
MPAPAVSPADAVLQITVTEFKEYTAKDVQCPYEIIALSAKEDKDGKNQPIWKFNGKVSLHVGHYQKEATYKTNPKTPTTVRLEKAHDRGTVEFRIVVDKNDPSAYHVVGVVFVRADGTKPLGIPFSTGKHPHDNFPFGNVKINDPLNTIEIDLHKTNHLPTDENNSGTATHRTYRFMIFIQRASDGAIAVIDPEIEDPNDH